MDDLIYKSAVIDILNEGAELLRHTLEEVDIIGAERVKYEFGLGLIESCIDDIKGLSTVQPEWNNQAVACLLAELFNDTCACNYNGIDEWLPEKCELLDSCPSPGGVACWEQYLKYRMDKFNHEYRW